MGIFCVTSILTSPEGVLYASTRAIISFLSSSPSIRSVFTSLMGCFTGSSPAFRNIYSKSPSLTKCLSKLSFTTTRTPWQALSCRASRKKNEAQAI